MRSTVSIRFLSAGADGLSSCAALRLVIVFRRQAHVDVLSREVHGPIRHVESQTLTRRVSCRIPTTVPSCHLSGCAIAF